MRAIIVAGSPEVIRPPGLRPQPGDLVIGADLGAAHCLRWGWRPSLVIGDLDSLPAGVVAEEAAGRVIRHPRDITDAHYSVAYGAAVRFYRGGNGFFEYVEEDLSDPRFRALEDKVEVYIDPQSEEERLRLNNRGAIVTIETNDGRKLEKRVQYSKGHPMNPMTEEDMRQKFLNTVTPRLGAKRTAELLERVENVESLDN